MKIKLRNKKPKWSTTATSGGWAWEEKEIRFVKENISKINPFEIGKALGRSRNAINAAAYRLGLMPAGEKCQRPVKKARNGRTRGVCSNIIGHQGQCCNETCSVCGNPAKMYKGCKRLCLACIAQKRKKRNPKTTSEAASNYCLRKAYKSITHLSQKEGWMDSGLEEQKALHDYIRPAQWFRAAEIFVRFKLKCRIRFAATYEDSIFDNRCRFVTFEQYATELGLRDTWVKLIEKIKNIHKKVN